VANFASQGKSSISYLTPIKNPGGLKASISNGTGASSNDWAFSHEEEATNL
jgi:hypothetical protein